MSQLPAELWLKVLVQLDYFERIKAEMVSRQFAEISKATWINQRKIYIEVTKFNNSRKISILLNRCGSYVEEISTQIGLPQLFGDELLLGQICPNLKSISSRGCATFRLINVPEGISPEAIKSETDRLLTSLTKLIRLDIFEGSWYGPPSESSNIYYIDRKDLFLSLGNVPTLKELHHINWPVIYRWNDLAQLQQLQVLSITSDEVLPAAVCQLTQLRELFLHSFETDKIDNELALQIGSNLKNLECLVIIPRETKINFSLLVPILVKMLPKLSTLLLFSYERFLQPTKVDLSPFRHRQVRLNLLVDHQSRSAFYGTSAQVKLVPIDYYRGGEALKFLINYNQNGFNFNSHSILKMMLRCRYGFF